MLKKYGKSLAFLSVAVVTLAGLYSFESKQSIVQNYKFQDKWICYQKIDTTMNIMHLKFTNSTIVENNKTIDGFEVLEDKKNYSEYDLIHGKNKHAHIIEISKNKLEYKKYSEKNPYICKRASSFEAVEDFTGKWAGYINFSKNEKKTKDDMIEKKIIITIYKDGIYINGENLPDDFSYQRIEDTKQEDGYFKIKLAGLKRDLPVLKYKIVNNKEIILLPTKELTEKETYLKRIDRF